MHLNEFPDGVEFLWRKAGVLAKANRLQPKFADHLVPLHMNMSWLAAIKAVEEEAIRPGEVSNAWHIFPILRKKS